MNPLYGRIMKTNEENCIAVNGLRSVCNSKEVLEFLDPGRSSRPVGGIPM